jgi:hypothetical protein
MCKLLKHLSITIFVICSGCQKDTFLDKKPNTNIVVPKSLDDMVQLLDNQTVMLYNTPASGILSSDDYYYPSLDAWNAANSNTERYFYNWDKLLFKGEKNLDEWNAPYKAVFYSNVVLDAWNDLSDQDKSSEKGRFVKAWALFERSFNFYNLALAFAPLYDKGTAQSDLGIPLRLSSDINEILPRSNVQQTYDLIISDISNALPLFSNSISAKTPNRPSTAAVYALLARIYLSMREYDKARLYADSTLLKHNTLLDYNTVDKTASIPFTDYNQELIFTAITNLTYFTVVMRFGNAMIDSGLIKMYSDTDLRKTFFFRADKGAYFMNKGYNGSGYYPFTGVAVDEVYLIKAECLARSGNLKPALDMINTLLKKRYATGTFTAYSSGNRDSVLNIILTERRKELVWRGLRWTDIRRLNKEGANITLKRVLNNLIYTLAPNDPKYVMPIPDDEIALSHIQQNVR